MVEFLQSGPAQAVIWTALGAMLLGLGVYLLKKFRDRTVNDQPAASEMLTTFREVHARGGLSDREFRTIKARLGDQIQAELKGDGKKD